jgi:hypothetical protein
LNISMIDILNSWSGHSYISVLLASFWSFVLFQYYLNNVLYLFIVLISLCLYLHIKKDFHFSHSSQISLIQKSFTN